MVHRKFCESGSGLLIGAMPESAKRDGGKLQGNPPPIRESNPECPVKRAGITTTFNYLGEKHIAMKKKTTKL
jgi:hypothetical protein